MEDREVEGDIEPNEQAHPDSSLDGSRDLYTVPVTIKMPDMGEGDDNVVGEWFKSPGDIIKYNDVLCDITTPDFTFGMVTEDEHDAIMGEILVEAGQQADDGAPICIIYHPDDGKSEEEKTEE
jgi:pyruvate/2-oxoglutarate dehydrogenase complex dihydrolipoamide acyltransferase (E2) component